MTATETCRWQGASGTSYTYYVYSLPPNFSSQAGNYIFAKRDGLGGWKAVYIGQTGDLSQRFGDHHAEACVRRNGATHIHAHLNAAKIDREREEADLLAAHSTYCNAA